MVQCFRWWIGRCRCGWTAEIRMRPRRPGCWRPTSSSSENGSLLYRWRSSRGGRVVLGWVGRRAVGCAGLRPLGDGALELKHFFLAPEVRGRGFGRVLLAGVEEVARTLGARRLLLDTAAPLLEAAALYRSSGYEDVPRFNDNPVAVAWFARDLV